MDCGGGRVCARIVGDFEEGERRGETHDGEPFLLSDDGDQRTNFAGCVNGQFEITNVTGTLQDLDTVKSTLVVNRLAERNHLPQLEITSNH